MKPMFTSLTFPDHLSIATGLCEENHGVVSNNMYDPEFNVANQMVSKKRHSAAIMWPGSMSTYQGYHSGYQIPFSASRGARGRIELYKNRTKKMTEWMKTNEPVNLVLIYFDEPDSTSHVYPPFSAEVWGAVGLADEIVGILVDSLVKNHFYSDTNLMVVSGHGFAIVNESLDLTKATDMSL
ncbi:ectonucleotide pyrophosphatase/phosphodiesterase family member 5-like [Brevipalpus obovatus]|uniref:ectonucleotide pyrophosphatase/phosphodiesterase family member 5-like n=1 Tax=Brevipalpus obovatus TaxID=246614 RepID=UPI003D9F4D82